MALLSIAVSGCPAKSEPQPDASLVASSGQAKSTVGPDKLEAAIPLQLLKVEAVDGTPMDLRPDGLTLDPLALMKTAAWAPGAFSKVAEESENGCGLTASLVYALTANRQAVKTTEVGEARVGIVAALHCQVGEKFTSFKADVERFEAFGGPKDSHPAGTGTAVILGISKKLASEVVTELAGKVMLRGASDDEILKTLASSDHTGKLLEAALEAGERRLKKAIPALIRLTGHERSNIAMRAAAALGMLGASSDEVVAALVAMTRGSEVEKHLVAVNTLSDLNNPIVVRYLNTIAEGHPEPAIRELAREGAKRATARSQPAEDSKDAPVE